MDSRGNKASWRIASGLGRAGRKENSGKETGQGGTFVEPDNAKARESCEDAEAS